MTEPTKGPGEPAGTDRGRPLGLVLGLVLFALALLVVQARLNPPAPKGVDAPAAEFSGGRAHEILRTLVGDGSPHPVGSSANARVRETILAELRRLGYTPAVQEGTACSLGLNCAHVQNIVARLEGTQAGKAVLLMAHYDSVQAGPGVGDDLSGVASILEAARALKADPPPLNPVILLITDGEEAGLLGAELFAASPAAKEVGVVVNLEARGTAGPSLMFETIGDDAWMVGHYAGGVPRPITSSIYATIYEALPNDTDLSVFRRAGYQGMNFAFIRNPTHYHTPEDNVENLSPATLQHHGDNALGTVRALAQADLASPPKGDAVFFDVLGFGVVRWPKAWTPVLAVLALVLVAAASVLAARKRNAAGLPRRSLPFGLLGFLGSVVLAALLAFGLFQLIGASSPGPWAESPQPDVAAFWLLALAVVVFIAGAVSRRAGAEGLWSGVWIGWAALGLVVALTAPGIAYLFVVPALVAGIAGLATRPGGTVSSLVPAMVAFVLWIPILLPLYDGLGKTALVLTGLLAAALFTSLAPLVPDSGRLGSRLLPAAGLVLALVCTGLAFASSPYTEESPQPLSFQLFQDAGSGQARWLALGPGSLPASVREAGPFSAEREQAYPWNSVYRVPVAPAPRLEAPGPQLSVLEDSSAGGKRRLRLLLTSNRQASRGSIVIPPEAKLESARMDGQEIPLNVGGGKRQPRRPDAWTGLSMLTLGPDGAELEIVLGEVKPLEWYVYDISPGLPPGGAALQSARPASAVPIQQGDNTAIARKVRI